MPLRRLLFPLASSRPSYSRTGKENKANARESNLQNRRLSLFVSWFFFFVLQANAKTSTKHEASTERELRATG